MKSPVEIIREGDVLKKTASATSTIVELRTSPYARVNRYFDAGDA
jgi:hypothetical protein